VTAVQPIHIKRERPNTHETNRLFVVPRPDVGDSHLEDGQYPRRAHRHGGFALAMCGDL